MNGLEIILGARAEADDPKPEAEGEDQRHPVAVQPEGQRAESPAQGHEQQQHVHDGGHQCGRDELNANVNQPRNGTEGGRHEVPAQSHLPSVFLAHAVAFAQPCIPAIDQALQACGFFRAFLPEALGLFHAQLKRDEEGHIGTRQPGQAIEKQAGEARARTEQIQAGAGRGQGGESDYELEYLGPIQM